MTQSIFFALKRNSFDNTTDISESILEFDESQTTNLLAQIYNENPFDLLIAGVK